MLQVESANSGVRRAAGTPVSRSQSRCSSRGIVSPNYAKSQQRFDFESELTFSPKLNNTSLKLVQERRDQGLVQRARLPRETRHSEFTFRPQMSTASLKIAEGLGTTFMARQEMHVEKQKKLLQQGNQLSLNLKGRLSPVTKNKKTKDKENTDNLAWGTPISTPNLTDKRSSSQTHVENNDGSNDCHHPGISGSASILTPQLNPVRGVRSMPPMQSSINLQRISDTSSPYAPGSSVLLKREKSTIKDRSPRLHKRGNTHPPEAGAINDSGNDSDTPGQPGHHRSRTVGSPDPPSPRTRARIMGGQGLAPTGERLRLAKLIADKAIKKNKVFMIQGPYPVVRECLRRRDWVEKQYRAMAPHKVKKAKNDSDDDSDDDTGDPDDYNDNGCHGGSDVDEDNGLDDSDSVYGIMSRIVRNSTPSFIWTCRAGGIDYKFLKKDAYVNHFAKNSAFTTKVGLCTNLQSLSSFGTVDPDSFFPRCYKICSEEEKNAFIDDYRLTAACSIVKWVVQRHNGELDIPMDDNKDSDEEEEEDGETTDKESTSKQKSTSTSTPRKVSRAKKNNDRPILATSLIDRAIKIINNYFSILDHEDIDWPMDTPPLMSEEEWDKFIKEYYQLIYDGGIITGSANYVDQCSSIVNRLRASKTQLDMEGLRNIWIVKPGAKSRGRGITCMNKLDEILKLVGSALVQKEGKWVAQKYIERPLLVYNTKFDIRQWFLVTDWNPLTVWFYASCYLRFCSHPFSLVKMDSSIHLSNQSIQKHYEVCPSRSRMLPEDNMWTSDEFQKYLKKRGCGNVWSDVVYPGMKKAVIAALECCQDVVEPRKGSFELYGADFMLTEDFNPWLIEINSSPAMGATTEITEKMCYDVIEDTMKVVLDRKHDKNCDTGQFELVFKQSGASAPQYIGQALAVEGSAVRKPLNRQKSSPNLVNVPRLGTSTTPARKQCGEPQRSKATVNRTEKMVSVSDDPSIARATNLEEMKKKLAESPPQPPNSGTITADSQGDSQPHQSSSSSTLIDVAWGRTCTRCGNGAGVKLAPDQADAKCPCRKDNLIIPAPFIQPPGEPPKPAFKVQEPIPRSGTFISNRKGELVTLMGPDPIPGMHKTGRAGFMQGRIRPNMNRQRRQNRALMQADDMMLLVPFNHSVSNSLSR